MTVRLRRLLGPGLMTVAMLAVLVGLGTWQVQRLHWKRTLLAQIARAEAAPAVPLPDRPQPFTKVRVSGHLSDEVTAAYGVEVRETQVGPVMGTHLIAPLERETDDTILVDRGWIPDKRLQPLAPAGGDATVEGYVRPSDKPGLFSVSDNPTARRFYTLNAATIGATLGFEHVAPFILVAMGPALPQHYPDPAHQLPRPPNNHLSYAITWYGLAVALVVIFVLWARKVVNE